MCNQTKLNRQNWWATPEVNIHLANLSQSKKLVNLKNGCYGN